MDVFVLGWASLKLFFCQALASIVCFGFGSLYYTRGKQIGLVRFPVHL